MDQTKAAEILEKQRQDRASDAELEILELWLAQYRLDEPNGLTEEEFKVSSRRMWTNIEAARQPAVKVVPLWKKWSVAAAAVAAITLGTWLYDSGVLNRRAGEGRYQDPNAIAMKNDIAPGKNTATLTLASGETINLSDAKTGVVIDAAKLTYSDGEELSISSESGPRRGGPEVSSETTQFSGSRAMSVITPLGGTYQVVLPDGTKVWLNAASSVKFPSSFAGAKQRRIEMTGEVYLDVAKDKSRPFIVVSRSQQIEVLGTHFNVNAYIDEGNVKTTLLEGSVKVSSTTQREAAILKPNQQSILSNTNRIEVKQVNTAEAVAWKEGNFVFNNEDIETIMRHIARWYNIEVKYEGSLPAGEFSGNVSRSKNISQVLQALELTKLVHFKVEGRTVVVTK